MGHDRPAPTPVNQLGQTFKRQHKYHPARPYRWWEFRPTPPEATSDGDCWWCALGAISLPFLILGVPVLFALGLGELFSGGRQELLGLFLFLGVLYLFSDRGKPS